MSSSDTSTSNIDDEDWTTLPLTDDTDGLLMNVNGEHVYRDELRDLCDRHVIVTGGCGFVGRYICEMLLKIGAHVRVFDLRINKYNDDIEFIQGDLLNMMDVNNAMKNQYACIHVASPPPTLNNPKIFHNVNVNGTANIISACRLMNVQKLVYTSSASVVFDGRDQRNFDEQVPPPERALDGYTISKLKAERLVLSAAAPDDRESLAVCALRPHGIFGPRDPHLMPALGRAGKGGKSHYMIGNGENLVDFTYVENVAFAHCLAASRLRPEHKMNGRAYFITNQQPVLFWDFVSRLQEGMGYALPYLVMPVRMMLVVAWFANLFSKVLAFTPTFTKQSITYASVDHYYSSRRAYLDFGYAPVFTLEQGIQRTLAHFEELVNPKARSAEPDLHLTESAHPTVHVSQQSPVPVLHLSSVLLPFVGFTLLLQLVLYNSLWFGEYYSPLVVKLCFGCFLPYFLFHIVMECKYFKYRSWNDEGIDLNGKVVVVTGANRGIGYAVALELARLGATVILACRNADAAERARDAIIEATNNRNVSYGVCDLSKYSSVRSFVDKLQTSGVKVDFLVNNAATMQAKQTTGDGMDLMVQSNHLSVFLLTNLFLDKDILSDDGRVVNVSSWMHVNGQIDWENINNRDGRHRPFVSYCNTKLMNILFSSELDRKFRAMRSQRTSVALHPGNVQTDFILHFIPQWLKSLVDPLLSLFLLQTDECAMKILMACVGKEMRGVGGAYLSHGAVSRAAPAARDRRSMTRLWLVSERLVKHRPKWYTAGQ